MSDYDSDDRDWAEYHNDQMQLQKATVEALAAAKTRPLTEDELMLVAWSAGLSNEVFKEIRK